VEGKVSFLVVTCQSRYCCSLPVAGEGELYLGDHLPRRGDLIHLEGEFWEVAHVVYWDKCLYPTVVLIPYQGTGLVLC